MAKFWIAWALFVSLYGTTVFAQKPATSDQVFENAKIQAAQEQKLIFLVFGASWCPPCHELDAFMAARETRTVLEKYFVLSKLNVEEEARKHPERNNPGGEQLTAKLGGADAKGKTVGVPFFAFLDATGESIVNSNRPVNGHQVGENIGFPSEPEEIDWFLTMLKKTVPMMTAEEFGTINKWLRKQSAIDHLNRNHAL